MPFNFVVFVSLVWPASNKFSNAILLYAFPILIFSLRPSGSATNYELCGAGFWVLGGRVWHGAISRNPIVWLVIKGCYTHAYSDTCVHLDLCTQRCNLPLHKPNSLAKFPPALFPQVLLIRHPPYWFLWILCEVGKSPRTERYYDTKWVKFSCDWEMGSSISCAGCIENVLCTICDLFMIRRPHER